MGAVGVVKVRFVVLRDGSITETAWESRSGNGMLDLEAMRSVQSANGHLPPLPAAYLPNRLTITLTFPYQR